MNAKLKHVVVSLRMATIAGQDKLSGIFEYLADNHRWSVTTVCTTNSPRKS